MYRVILVDDERLIIRGLSSVVPWAELGCEVAGVAYDGNTGLELIRQMEPDIVLTDIRMPNMDGLTMLAAIRSEYPGIQTAVLTAYRDFDYARQALTLGVCRYLLKPSNLEELKEAVRIMTSRLDTMPPRKEGREEEVQEEAVQAAGNHLVRAAMAYIREHCTEQHLSLSEVADHVYVSQWHLSKLLNRETGQSFSTCWGPCGSRGLRKCWRIRGYGSEMWRKRRVFPTWDISPEASKKSPAAPQENTEIRKDERDHVKTGKKNSKISKSTEGIPKSMSKFINRRQRKGVVPMAHIESRGC